MTCCFPAGNPAEDRADRQPESGQVALPENVAGHHFPGGEDILCRALVLHNHAGLLVHRNAHIGKGDARAQWIGEIRRGVYPPCPVALWRIESLGSTIVQTARVERAGPHGPVKLIYYCRQRWWVQT